MTTHAGHPGVRLCALAGAVLLVLLAAGLQAAEKEANEVRLERAAALHGSGKTEEQDEAVRLCREVVADEHASRAQKFGAFRTLTDTLWGRRRDAPAGVAAMDEMRAAFPGDAEADRTASFRAADILWESGKDLESGVSRLTEFVGRLAADPATAAQAQLRLSRFQARLRHFEEAYAAGARAMALVPDDLEMESAALWEMQGAADGLKDPERRYQALRRAMEPRLLDRIDAGGRYWRQVVFGQVLMATKRFDDLRVWFAPLEQNDPDPAHRQEWCLTQAESYLQQERLDDALAACERAFTAHPTVHNQWWNAQSRIVGILRRQNRLEEALRATRILLDAAWDHETFSQACEHAVAILVAIDDLPDRANAFLAWQSAGVPVKDGAAANPAPTADPLAACSYPDTSARAQAFARVSAELGDTVVAARHRACMALYSGRPRDALAHDADAFARSGLEDLDWVGPELVQQAVRAVVGHGGRTPELLTFIAWGPAGPDETPGTADDLADPFASLGLPPRPAAGGLAMLPPAEVTALQQLSASLQALAANPDEAQQRRTECVRGLGRIQEALASWQPEPLRDLARQIVTTTEDRELMRTCLSMGAQCAKGADLHLGGCRAFWKQIDADLQARESTLDEWVLNSTRKQLERVSANLLRQKALVPRTRPIPVIVGENPPLEACSPAAPVPGLKVVCYELDPKSKPRSLPDLAALQPKAETTTETVSTRPATRGEYIALWFTGYIKVPRSTGYRFVLRSRGGSRLLIGDLEVVNHDGMHGANDKAGTINLKAGCHPIAVQHVGGQGGTEVSLSWESYGISKQPVPPAALFRDGP